LLLLLPHEKQASSHPKDPESEVDPGPRGRVRRPPRHRPLRRGALGGG